VARARKVPDFPIIVLPANIEELEAAALQSLAEETFPEALKKLTDQ